MGRIDNINATTQYHQGLQSQETIDDAPPLDDDLYEPPPDYQRKPKKSLVADNIKPRPNEPQQPQAIPPFIQDDENKTQSFPPKQGVHNNNEDDDYLNQTQQFPPRQHEAMGVQFPPAGQSSNFVHHHQPPPVAAGIGGKPVQLGMLSPSPMLIPNQLPITHQPWKTHLFDCMKDPQNAIVTACCPCVTFGQIAEIVDSGTTSCGRSGMMYSLIACCIAMPCLMSCGYRSKMRAKFGLVESPAPDFLVHCFCEWCALCQEYRELQERGLDPSIGWMGNVAKQQQQMQQMQQFGMAPPMHQRMMG